MKRSNKAMLAAGMLAGVCMLPGCASGGSAQPTPSTDVAQQQSAEGGVDIKLRSRLFAAMDEAT